MTAIRILLQCTVRDLFGRQDLGNFTASFTAPIFAHGAGALKVTPITCAITTLNLQNIETYFTIIKIIAFATLNPHINPKP
jgi:hypothetical protein